MHTYIFELGRKNLISVAELEAKLPENANFISITRNFAAIEFENGLDNPQSELNSLGGTIKISELLSTSGKNPQQIFQTVSKVLIDLFKVQNKKITYAVSVQNLPQGPEKFLKKFLISLKKELQKNEVKSRFINNNFQNPSTALLKGENIPSEKAENLEINLYFDKNEVLISKTVALQDIDNYSNRDFERPERDPRLGMLPPKLAQILINLSGLKKFGARLSNQKSQEKVPELFDPFCGIGTILSEGLLMDFSVIGSDLSLENIQKSDKNIKWLLNREKQNNSTAKLKNYKIYQDDARLLKNLPQNFQPDAVISETYLGLPYKKCPDEPQIKKTFDEIENLLISFLERISPNLKAETPIVLTILTYFQPPSRFIFPQSIIKKIEKIGFVFEPLLSSNTIQNFSISCPDQNRLIYSRPDQVVCRSIVKLRKAN